MYMYQTIRLPLSLSLSLTLPHSLLAEYHALYELQRKRLEDQVSNLTFERDLWQQASYDLAQRVADECNLQTLQRIQLSEKSWCKLAGHFAVLLSDKDTQQVCVCVCVWCVCVCVRACVLACISHTHVCMSLYKQYRLDSKGRQMSPPPPPPPTMKPGSTVSTM